MNRMYIPTTHKRHNSIKAFTLIELMVVVGIITILGVIVGPGFKKAYEDFLLQETLSDADVLLQSYRSYYLIYNEFPGDTNGDYVVKDVANFLPSNFFKKTKMSVTTNGESVARSVYQLVNKPFNDSELLWDFNNWITWDRNTTEGSMYLSLQPLQGTQKINSCVEAFKKQYPLDRPQPFWFVDPKYNVYYILVPFPEFPLKANLDSISKNRYY